MLMFSGKPSQQAKAYRGDTKRQSRTATLWAIAIVVLIAAIVVVTFP